MPLNKATALLEALVQHINDAGRRFIKEKIKQHNNINTSSKSFEVLWNAGRCYNRKTLNRFFLQNKFLCERFKFLCQNYMPYEI